MYTIEELQKQIAQIKYNEKLEKQKKDLTKFVNWYNNLKENGKNVPKLIKITGEKNGRHFVQYYFYQHYYFEKGAPLRLDGKTYITKIYKKGIFKLKNKRGNKK